MPRDFSAFKGRSAALVRELDWDSTPLGPMHAWHPEMRSWVEFILESRFPAAIVLRAGLVTIYNDAFAPILGDKPEAMGRSFADVWGEVWEEIGPIAERAFAGEATFIEDFALTINRIGKPEQAWFTFCYSPLRLSDGTIVAMMDTVVETTPTVRARRQLYLMNRELSHRLKNSMAIAKAVALQTLKEVQGSPPVQSFLGRIDAIAHAQNELLHPDRATRSLNDIVLRVLSPIDGLQQIEVWGPDVPVGPDTSISLSMMLYELATNAAKYGALSTPHGRIDLVWGIQGDSVYLTWAESGGPKVVPPASTGFGSRLIDGGLGFGSSVKRRYPETGFQADIRFPLHLLRR
jgi:two-component sensor histidine kinase